MKTLQELVALIDPSALEMIEYRRGAVREIRAILLKSPNSVVLLKTPSGTKEIRKEDSKRLIRDSAKIFA